MKELDSILCLDVNDSSGLAQCLGNEVYLLDWILSQYKRVQLCASDPLQGQDVQKQMGKVTKFPSPLFRAN